MLTYNQSKSINTINDIACSMTMTDRQMTEFLKTQFLITRELIHCKFNALKLNHHLEIAFYRNGQVKIASIENGKDGKFYDAIISIVLSKDMKIIDDKIIYGIESRVYRT